MDRFERQRLFLGAGHDRLREMHVGVVGLGGLGSHVVQQLAYLGVGTMAAVDHDKLDVTNRNRLVGARHTDPDGMPKTEIAMRTAAEIDPSIKVIPYPSDVRDLSVREHLMGVDWVFGCVDNDGTRVVLTDLCTSSDIGYIDLATEIHADMDPLEYGGRVCVSLRGNGCPYCHDLLSQEEMRADLADDDEREDHATIYGVTTSSAGPGPAVVYLNGLMASLAVAEFAAAVAGLRAPASVLEYRGSTGVVMRTGERPGPGCVYCCRRSRAAVDG